MGRAQAADLELAAGAVVVALFLVGLVFGGFAVYALHFVPGVRFHWRWLGWSAFFAFAFIGGLLSTGSAVELTAIVIALVLAIGAGAFTAIGGLGQIMFAIDRQRREDRRTDGRDG